MLRTWLLWRVDEFFSYDPTLTRQQHGPRLAAIAEGLLSKHSDFTGEERTACRLAARFLRVLDQPTRALAALDTAAHCPGGTSQPIIEDQLRAAIYHSAKMWDDEIATYRSLLQRRPDVTPYMESLADALEAGGKPDQARPWRDRADPGRLLLGKPAPPFNVALLNGGTLTLESALRGHKAVLLDFWFCACGPCRLTFPHLEKLHAAYDSHGLAVVAVNSGDAKDAIERFAKEHSASFAIGVGRAGKTTIRSFTRITLPSFRPHS